MDDQNTPSIKLRQPGLIVYACGFATSIGTILAVKYCNRSDFYVMGWFLNGVIPMGAILVGIVSGLGYALGSRYFHVKLGLRFLVLMFVTGIFSYFAVQYLTYTSVIEAAGVPAEAYSFVDYMRDQAEKMSFQDRHSRTPGSPLGIWGYCFQALILLGFAFGAMAPSAFVLGMAYCHRCQTYLKPHRVRYVRSPENWSDVKALKKAERKVALEGVAIAIGNRAQQIAQSVSQSSFEETDAVLSNLDPAQAKDAAATVAFTLLKCPHCDAHHLAGHLYTFDAAKRDASGPLFTLDKTEFRPSRPLDQAADDTNPPPAPNDDGLFREQ